MPIIEEVLEEELKRVESHCSSYEQMLSTLPKGSLVIVKIGKECYAYRKWREGNKVLSEYLGKANSPLVQKAQEDSLEYRRIKKNLSESWKIEKKLRKALKAFSEP